MSSSQGRMQTRPGLGESAVDLASRCFEFVAPETRAPPATNGLPLPRLCQTFPQSRVGYAPDETFFDNSPLYSQDVGQPPIDAVCSPPKSSSLSGFSEDSTANAQTHSTASQPNSGPQ